MQKTKEDEGAHCRAIFESSLVGIASTDRELRFLEVNEAFVRLLGYAEAELVGQKSIADITHPDDRVTSRELLESLMRGEVNPSVRERRFVTRSGRELDAMTSVQPLYDRSGAFLCATVLILDITERKRTEMALRESEEKFARIFHCAPVLMTLGDVEEGRCLDVNAKFLEVSGFKREELIGRRSVEVGWISAEDRVCLREELAERGGGAEPRILYAAKGWRCGELPL